MSATLGWLGAVALSLCGVPAAWKAFRDGHAHGMSGAFLALWWLGEAAMLGHVLLEHKGAALAANYAANVLIVGVIVFFKLRNEVFATRVLRVYPPSE